MNWLILRTSDGMPLSSLSHEVSGAMASSAMSSFQLPVLNNGNCIKMMVICYSLLSINNPRLEDVVGFKFIDYLFDKRLLLRNNFLHHSSALFLLSPVIFNIN